MQDRFRARSGQGSGTRSVRAAALEPLEPRTYLSAIVKANTTTFMAIGDSITAGQAYNGSYRLPLQQELSSAGYKYKFVGDLTIDSNGMSQPNHEGYPGYRLINSQNVAAGEDSLGPGTYINPNASGQLYGAVMQHALTTYHPNVILLMAGINDMRGVDANNVNNRAKEFYIVLTQIFSLEPSVKLICAPITYKRGEIPDAQIDACDVQFQLVEENFKSRGYDIEWAPQAGGSPAGSMTSSPYDTPDHIHPGTADAYKRMANGFFNAIVQGTAGDTAVAPTVSAVNSQVVALPSVAHLSVAVTPGYGAYGAHATETWTKVYGPGSVAFTSPSASASNASFSAPGIYQLRLTVNNGSLYSTKDIVVTVGNTAHPATVPAAPTNAYAVDTPSGLVLHWTNNANNATDYVIERASNPAFTWYESTFVTTAGTTSYTIPNIIKGQTFYLRVYAYDTVGASADSKTVELLAQYTT